MKISLSVLLCLTTNVVEEQIMHQLHWPLDMANTKVMDGDWRHRSLHDVAKDDEQQRYFLVVPKTPN